MGLEGVTAASSVREDPQVSDGAAGSGPDAGGPSRTQVTGKEWEAAWGAVIERRMREVTEGKVELVDGDQVDAEIQALIDTRDP